MFSYQGDSANKSYHNVTHVWDKIVLNQKLSSVFYHFTTYQAGFQYKAVDKQFQNFASFRIDFLEIFEK